MRVYRHSGNVQQQDFGKCISAKQRCNHRTNRMRIPRIVRISHGAIKPIESNQPGRISPVSLNQPKP